jgi:uncharacterized membrane protein
MDTIPFHLLILLLVLRYMHILGAIMLMGGTIFMRFALAPTVLTLEGSTRAEFHERVRSRWSKFVMLASGLLLVSGLANMLIYSKMFHFEMQPDPLFDLKYPMLVGIKFILALPIFFFASLLAGRSETAKKFQAKTTFWMNVNLALALLMVLIGGLLKFVDREYKKPDETAAVSAAPAESARQILPLEPITK